MIVYSPELLAALLGLSMLIGVSVDMVLDSRRPLGRRTKVVPGLTRMWCDDCKHLFVRDRYGKDSGHRRDWCNGANSWKMPPPVSPLTPREQADAAGELAALTDESLRQWVLENAGVPELSPEDMRMFREQLDLIRTIEH